MGWGISQHKNRKGTLVNLMKEVNNLMVRSIMQMECGKVLSSEMVKQEAEGEIPTEKVQFAVSY